MIRKSAHATVTEIKMKRQVRKRAFLIVEGKNDREALYDHIDKNSCGIIIADGKINAKEALQSLEDDGIPGIVCLVDSDYDDLSSSPCTPSYDSDNLISTEAHDMDVIIFQSRAIDIYLQTMADPKKLENFQTQMKKTIRDTIFNSTTPVANLRLLSHNLKLGLRFSNINWEFIDEKDLSVDEDKILTSLGWEDRPDSNDLHHRYKIVKNQNHPKHKLCQGHDLMTVLGIALRECIADIKDIRSERKEVEKGCRLAFGWEVFKQTDLYRSFRQWEEKSKPYRLLATD